MIYKLFIITHSNRLECFTDNPRNAVDLWHAYLNDTKKLFWGPPKTHTMSLVTDAGGFTIQFADIVGMYWEVVSVPVPPEKSSEAPAQQG